MALPAPLHGRSPKCCTAIFDTFVHLGESGGHGQHEPSNRVATFHAFLAQTGL